MENILSELKNKWDNINYYSGGALKLSYDHPLEWHVRYATPECKSIVILSHKEINNIESSKCIHASCNQRKDGKFAILFTLIDKNQEDVFITMAGDIIEYSNVETIELSLIKVINRYNAWLKLLDHKNNALLSINCQKGLIAELLFLKERIESGFQVSTALGGWIGPDGSDQDFVYSDCWYEIKATGAASITVSISSLQQLDRNDYGELVVYRIDKCSPEQNMSISLYRLVQNLIEIISNRGENYQELLMKLASSGYINMKEYDKYFFIMTSKQIYMVNESFPKIRREDVAIEISNAKYQIDLPSINSWKK